MSTREGYAAALGAGDALALGELAVTRVHTILPTTLAVVQHGFVDIAAGNADLFAVLHVGNGATTDGFLDGFLDVLAVAAQKALAVDRALVLAIQASIDHVAHRPLRTTAGGWRLDEASRVRPASGLGP